MVNSEVIGFEVPIETRQDFDTYVVTLKCYSGISADLAELVDERTPAVVLISYPCGTTPSYFTSLFVSRVREKGVPVFVVSGEGYGGGGIDFLDYESESSAVEAGATPLQNVDSYYTNHVIESVQILYEEGLRGQELIDFMVAEYGSPEVNPKGLLFVSGGTEPS